MLLVPNKSLLCRPSIFQLATFAMAPIFASHAMTLYALMIIAPLACAVSINPTLKVITWQSAVRKGTLLYQKLQSGCYPDKPNPVDLATLYALGWSLDEDDEWPPRPDTMIAFGLEDRLNVFKVLPLTQGPDYYRLTILHNNGIPFHQSLLRHETLSLSYLVYSE